MSRPHQNDEIEHRQCIFCLEQKPINVFDPEHVFPEAIGSRKFVVYSVCRTCNNEIGSRVDTTLSDHFMAKVHRAKHQIRSKGGKVPDPLLSNEVKHTNAKTGDPVVVSKDKNGVYVVKPHPGVSHSVIDEGIANSSFSIDADQERNAEFIKARLRGAMKSHPLIQGIEPPQISDNHLAELARDGKTEVEDIAITANRGSIDKIASYVEFAESGFEPGIVKIVYELAVKWLGPTYLGDPQAKRLRDFVNAGLRGPVDLNEVAFDGTTEFGPSSVYPELWSDESDWHRAIMTNVAGRIIISIKIFDQFQGTIVVSDTPDRYNACDMFVTVNPANADFRERPMHDELRSRMILE